MHQKTVFFGRCHDSFIYQNFCILNSETSYTGAREQWKINTRWLTIHTSFSLTHMNTRFGFCRLPNDKTLQLCSAMCCCNAVTVLICSSLCKLYLWPTNSVPTIRHSILQSCLHKLCLILLSHSGQLHFTPTSDRLWANTIIQWTKLYILAYLQIMIHYWNTLQWMGAAVNGRSISNELTAECQ
jgi:hypothetical protein